MFDFTKVHTTLGLIATLAFYVFAITALVYPVVIFVRKGRVELAALTVFCNTTLVIGSPMLPGILITMPLVFWLLAIAITKVDNISIVWDSAAQFYIYCENGRAIFADKDFHTVYKFGAKRHGRARMSPYRNSLDCKAV